MRLLRPGDFSEINLGDQLSFRNLTQRNIGFILIQRQRTNQRTLPHIQLADTLRNHIHQNRNTGNANTRFLDQLYIHEYTSNEKEYIIH